MQDTNEQSVASKFFRSSSASLLDNVRMEASNINVYIFTLIFLYIHYGKGSIFRSKATCPLNPCAERFKYTFSLFLFLSRYCLFLSTSVI